jgi:hypothetical protein
LEKALVQSYLGDGPGHDLQSYLDPVYGPAGF